MTLEDIKKAFDDYRAAVEAQFAQFQANAIKPELITAMQAQLDEVRTKMPTEIVAGIHNASKSPEVEKRERALKVLKFVTDHRNDPNRIPQEMKDLGVDVGTYGGYAVGSDLSNMVMEKTRDATWWLSMCDRKDNVPMKGSFPVEGSTGMSWNWSQAHGGTQITKSTPTYELLNYSLSDVTGRTPVDNGLLQFAEFDVASDLTRRIGLDYAEELAKQFLEGTGSGRPLGLRNCTGYVATTQASAHYAADDVANLVYGVPTKYRGKLNMIVMMSENVAKWTMKLKDATAGTLFMNARDPNMRGLAGKELPEQGLAGFVYGYPCYVHPNMPDTEAWAGPLSMYMAFLGAALEIASSDHSLFGYNQTEVRAVGYADGRCGTPAAFNRLASIAQ